MPRRVGETFTVEIPQKVERLQGELWIAKSYSRDETCQNLEKMPRLEMDVVPDRGSHSH